MWLNVNLGKVNLETCWPAVYLVGHPTCPQGTLASYVLTGPALLHLPIIADQSQASWPLCSPPPSPSVSMFLASLHWFSSVTGAVVLGGHRVAMDTSSVGHYCIRWPFYHQEPNPRLISQSVLRNRSSVCSIFFEGGTSTYVSFIWKIVRVPSSLDGALQLHRP